LYLSQRGIVTGLEKRSKVMAADIGELFLILYQALGRAAPPGKPSA